MLGGEAAAALDLLKYPSTKLSGPEAQIKSARSSLA